MGKGHSSTSKAIKRDPMKSYRHKVEKITKWWNQLMKNRENPQGDNLINPNTKKEPKRAELKPLSYYIDKIRKPKGV